MCPVDTSGLTLLHWILQYAEVLHSIHKPLEIIQKIPKKIMMEWKKDPSMSPYLCRMFLCDTKNKWVSRFTWQMSKLQLQRRQNDQETLRCSTAKNDSDGMKKAKCVSVPISLLVKMLLSQGLSAAQRLVTTSEGGESPLFQSDPHI